MTDDILQQIIEPELCEHYRQLLEGIPEELPAKVLEDIISRLSMVAYTQMFRELTTIAPDRMRNLSRNNKERLNALRRKGESVKQGDLGKLFSQDIAARYSVNLVKPGADLQTLIDDLADVKTCWVDKNERDSPRVREVTGWLQRDVDVGACITLFNTRPSYILLPFKRKPTVYTRAYISRSKKDETLLFIDTIEAGEIGWSEIYEWTARGRGRELLYAIAATIYIAQQLGIEKVVAGEREAQELASLLGFKEEDLYIDRYETLDLDACDIRKAQKIGYPPGHTSGTEGPYSYQLGRSSTRRVIPVSEVLRVPEEELRNGIESIVSLVEVTKVRKNAQKMEELEMYLGSIEALAGARNDADLLDFSQGLRKKYF